MNELGTVAEGKSEQVTRFEAILKILPVTFLLWLFLQKVESF